MKVIIKRAMATIFLLANLVAVVNAASDTAHGPSCAVTGKVIKVTDGDTVKVLDAAKKTHIIRLAGIDAPERGQPYGKAASKYLAKQINQKIVCITGSKRDRYRRLVGVIWYQNRDINLAMVEAGYAWHYKKYQREQTPRDRVIYSDSEIQAKSDVIPFPLSVDIFRPFSVA